MWIASRSAGEHHLVLGVFFFLDQAQRYVEQQVIGYPAVWAPPRPGRRTWRCTRGQFDYRIEYHAVRDRREGLRLMVATRSWQLRCAHCGATWMATAEHILAGDDWLACPQCDGWQLQCELDLPAEPAQPAPPRAGDHHLPDPAPDLPGIWDNLMEA